MQPCLAQALAHLSNRVNGPKLQITAHHLETQAAISPLYTTLAVDIFLFPLNDGANAGYEL